MLEFDNSKGQTALLRSLLVYIDKVKEKKAFSKDGLFNWHEYNKEVTFHTKGGKRGDSTNSDLAKINTDVRNNREPEIKGSCLKILEYHSKDFKKFIISRELKKNYDRNSLNVSIRTIVKDGEISKTFIQDLFNDVFNRKRDLSVEKEKPLPKNFIDSKICKRIEFDSNDLYVYVISATLNWAYKNKKDIVEAAKDQNCHYKYIQVSNTGGSKNMNKFLTYIAYHEQGDKIKILKMEEATFKIANRNSGSNDINNLSSANSMMMPIANDIVIYCNRLDN